ncbi:MAG: glycosyltransferase family 2 protein [Methylococcales bacterium]
MIQQNNPPKISIGMPVYNGERYIREALDSLLKQSFRDFELIISDNASTDNTNTICLEYAAKDSRIKYFRQDKNFGAGANFMFVLNHAIAEYFMWAASDDYWSDNWLEVLLGDFKPDTSIAFGHVVTIDENSSIIRKHKYKQFSKIKLLRLVQLFLSEENDYKANFIYGLYNRTMLLKFHFGETYGADVHFVFEIVHHGRLSTNPNALFFKRFLATSAANTAPEAYSSKFRKLFLLDYLSYYAAYLRISESYLLKIILFILLPIKYLKSIMFKCVAISLRVFGSASFACKSGKA